MRIARGTRIAATLLAVLIALSLVAARDGPAPAQVSQQGATVYSSMPLAGAGRPQAQAVVRGARLALEEAGGRAGAHPVRLVSLNNATRIAETWTPEHTVQNARRRLSTDPPSATSGSSTPVRPRSPCQSSTSRVSRRSARPTRRSA